MSLKVDISGLEQKIFEKSVAMKKTFGEAMKEEGGLLCVSLIKYTQPFGTGAKAKGQGESAIKRDLTEAFYVLPDSLCAGAVPIQKGSHAGFMQIFTSRVGVTWITSAANWRVSESLQSLESHHNSLRNKDGLVRSDRNKVDTQGRSYAVINLWVITQSQFNELLKFLVTRVGFAKNGWAQCAKKLGRANTDIPAWIKNYDAPASIIDETNDPVHPSLTLINQVDYTGRVLSESAKREAIEERRVKIGLAIDRAIKYGIKDK